MGKLKVNQVQFGESITPEENYILGVSDSTPETLKLSRQTETLDVEDVLTVQPEGHLTAPQSTDVALNDPSSLVVQAVLSSVIPTIIPAIKGTPSLKKTSPSTVAVKAGTMIVYNGKIKKLESDFPVINSMTLEAGNDYSVWITGDGNTIFSVKDNFDSPFVPQPSHGNAVKIGGFHYGLVSETETVASGSFAASGFTNVGGSFPWTQAHVDRIKGINEFSLWDESFKSAGEQHGFAFDPQTKVWVAIYFCGPDHIITGISRYNTPVASGTVLPKIPIEYGGDGVAAYGRLSAYEALEIVASHGCELLTQEEFASGALGVTEGQSLSGTGSTIPATKREPGYTSRLGWEQATGHIWTIGSPLTSVGAAWTAGPNRGEFHGGTGLPLFGGSRGDATASGSRASYWDHVFWYSDWNIGLRAKALHKTI